jgi:hypothetical protein
LSFGDPPDLVVGVALTAELVYAPVLMATCRYHGIVRPYQKAKDGRKGTDVRVKLIDVCGSFRFLSTGRSEAPQVTDNLPYRV